MRGRYPIPVVGITGSAGKTTTKEMISSILRQRWRILKTVSNHNAPRHTRERVKDLRPYHKAIVFEYGTIRPGHISLHCRYCRPDIAVITFLGSAHVGRFGGIKGLIRAKSEIIKGMNPEGLLVLNRDNRYTGRLDRSGFRGRVVYFGIDNRCDYRATRIRFRKGGMSFTVRIDGKDEKFSIPVYGRHMVYNALAAIAVARHLGFSADEIRYGLCHFSRMRGRMSIFKGIKGSLLVDDSYSANPEAVMAGIDALDRIGGDRSTVLVLGGMAELGQVSGKAHRALGAHVARKRVSRLVTVGTLAREISRVAVQKGVPSSRVTHFDTVGVAARKIGKLLPTGAKVFLKASHRYRFVRLVRALRRKTARSGSPL